MISLKQILNEAINAESTELYANGLKQYLPCFLDKKTKTIYLTGAFHNVDLLPKEVRKDALFGLGISNDMEFKVVFDGFYDKENKKFYTREEMSKKLKNKKQTMTNQSLNNAIQRYHKAIDKGNRLKVIQL